MQFAGAVLAGGQSRRMGQTKALLEVDGRAMADRVLDALRAARAEPLLIVGGGTDELAALTAPVIPDLHPGEGPVGGVLTALTHFAEQPGIDAVFVLACDVPWISPSTLNAIGADAVAHGDADVWVGRGDRIEPLCACWSTSVTTRELLREAFDGGERALHRVIEQMQRRVVDLGSLSSELRNVNSPNDLPQDLRSLGSP